MNKTQTHLTLLLALAFLGWRAGAQSTVTWTNTVGVSIDANNNLTRTASGWQYGNSEATSVETLAAGQDGWVSTVAYETDVTRIIGLTANNIDNGNLMNYGIQLGANANIHVVENGTVVAYHHYTTGAVFKVAREGTTVKYYINGILRYTSATASTGVLRVDVGMQNIGSTMKDVHLVQGSIAMTPPANLSAVAATATSINLSWSDQSQDETGFEI
jgi:hypothetical protein